MFYPRIHGITGSTGISLALACASRGYRCHIFMPDDQAKEKVGMQAAMTPVCTYTYKYVFI